jgi:hypothetical protein
MTAARTIYPGHGLPMTTREFAIYRRAFDNLVDCAKGPAIADACVEGWVADARPLLKGSGADQARRLLTGYMRSDIRAPGRQEHVCNL